MNRYDVIIIGAGLGGLSAGATLSKAGKSVLLIEQHSIPGGCATTTKRGEFTLELSLHELDGFFNSPKDRDFFTRLDIDDEVAFLRVPELYRFKSDTVDITIPDSVEGATAVLNDHFPDEEKAIDLFFKTIVSIYNEAHSAPHSLGTFLLALPRIKSKFANIIKYRNYSVLDLLDEITDNDDLKEVLTANIGYYHDTAESLSLLYFSVAQGSYYINGGYYIQGGSQKLSDALDSVIKKNGGELLLSTKVEKIISNKTGVTGVQTVSKKEVKNEFTAPVVIYGGALPQLQNLMANTKQALRCKQQMRKYDVAPALLSIYICFDKEPKEFGCKNYSSFFNDSGNAEDLPPLLNSDAFAFVDYSQVDSKLAPDGKAVGTITILSSYADWKKLTKEQYKISKEEVAVTLLNRLGEMFPGIQESITRYEVATPLTLERYTLNTAGTPYGFAQTPHQAFSGRVKQKSPSVKGLYFASAWTFPGGGISPTLSSGAKVALKIIKKKKLFKDK